MPDDAEEIVTGAELGERLGVSERTIRNLAEKQLLSRESPNRYRLWRSVTSYVSHLREQAAGRAAMDDEDGSPDLPKERALLARSQREGQNLRNAVLRAELLPREDVEEVVGAVTDAVRTKMLALPTKAAPMCVGLTTLNEARTLLTGMVHDALDELAATPVIVDRAADRARRRTGRGALGDGADAEAEAPASANGKRVGGREPPA